MTSPTELEHCTFDVTPMCSSITGRTILVNYDAQKFAILPSFSVKRLVSARADWETNMQRLAQQMAEKYNLDVDIESGDKVIKDFWLVGIDPLFQTYASLCFAATDSEEFATAVNAISTLISDSLSKARANVKRIFELLTVLWKHRLLAFPAGIIWDNNVIPTRALAPVDELFYGSVASRLRTIGLERPLSRWLRVLLTICGGIEEFSDIDHGVLAKLHPFIPSLRREHVRALSEQLRAFQLDECTQKPTKLSQIPDSYRHLFAPARVIAGQGDGQQKYVHFEPTPIRSSLTGRTILVNTDSSRFAILSEFSVESLAAARAAWDLSLRDSRMPRDIWQCIAPCFSATDIHQFSEQVEALLTVFSAQRSLYSRGKRGQLRSNEEKALAMSATKRIAEALTIMWKHGLLAFPAGEIWSIKLVGPHAMPAIDERFYGQLTSAIKTIDSSTRWSFSQRTTRMLFSACGLIEEVGDIDFEVLKAFRQHVPQYQRLPNIFCDELRTVQLQVYAEHDSVLKQIPQSYRSALYEPKQIHRSDPKFMWASRMGQRVEGWRYRMAAYVAGLKNRAVLKSEITLLNTLLDYVIDTPSVPGSPLDYCLRDHIPQTTYQDYLENTRKQGIMSSITTRRCASHFLDWVLENEASDDVGLVLRQYRNPLDSKDIANVPPRRGKTDRNAMPVRFLRMLREIIEENNFAWPRSLKVDYIERINEETGLLELVWCPVRALLILLRLQLPIRTLQARLLDSGEGDELVYRSAQGGWVPNTGRWAPDKGSKLESMGFVRRIWDPERGKWFNGLYITTNKTQDRNTLFIETGYEIPWESPEILDLFCRMRDWQEKYNPSLKPMSRAELSDHTLIASQDVAFRSTKLHFLFRDPVDRLTPMEPVSASRLKLFWRDLIAELERRLEAEGTTNEDGSKIVLTTRGQYGKTTGTIFDQHSLRVAGLTAFARAGVPIHILSEFVAGHATVLMTLYYYKPGASEITRALDEALLTLVETEQRDWAAYLRDQPLELIHEIAAYNAEEGLSSIKAAQPALWAPLDDGICPNGGTRCSVGGPLVEGTKDYHGPVPGGAYNCALCRFFVTGPAHLGGLVAKANETGGKIVEKAERLRQQEEFRRQLLAKEGEFKQEGKVLQYRRKLSHADDDVAKTLSELDVLWQTWHAQLRLVRRVELIMEARQGKPQEGRERQKNALVLNGRSEDVLLRAKLEKSTRFALWDRICQSSEFYPGIDTQVPALRRGKLFDAMFAREGHPAVFASLTDEQLVQVGNAVANFLRTQLGDATTDELILGRQTLEKLGIQEELDLLLDSAVVTPVLIEPHRVSISALPLAAPHPEPQPQPNKRASIEGVIKALPSDEQSEIAP